MEVILKKNVENLGFKDDVVKVRDGFGRNFLIPQGYAVMATDSARKSHTEVLRQRSHKESKIREAAEAIAAKLEGVTVQVRAKVGDTGKIFGSIHAIAISEALKSMGIEIDRKSITILGDNIKELGTYKANAILHKDVKKEFAFEVVEE